jgi:2-amino-4-hydroxy-6-hydroxymethyldihydropteridine diphosphokinase
LSAWELLGRSPIIHMAARSNLYRTVAVGGPAGQNDYVNAACQVRTDLTARELLDLCLNLERQFGRVRRDLWGPRTLDIDLLLYDDQEIAEPGLQVPHPRLRERLFVLVPLADVAPANMKLGSDGATLDRVLQAALIAAGETIEDWRHRVTD